MDERIKFMKEAIHLAKENIKLNNGGPFGSVVVKNGQIIGRGINSVTTENDPTAHAEINAIREACSVLNSFQLDDCDIYTSCEPCPMCLGAIYWARPRRIIFAASQEDAGKAGFDDSRIYHEFSLPGEMRTIPSEQILQKEAQQVFEMWNNSEHKIPY
jgi:guanine deaminase